MNKLQPPVHHRVFPVHIVALHKKHTHTHNQRWKRFFPPSKFLFASCGDMIYFFRRNSYLEAACATPITIMYILRVSHDLVKDIPYICIIFYWGEQNLTAVGELRGEKELSFAKLINPFTRAIYRSTAVQLNRTETKIYVQTKSNLSTERTSGSKELDHNPHLLRYRLSRPYASIGTRTHIRRAMCITPPWADFPCSISHISTVSWNIVLVLIVSVPKKSRRWKHLAECFPKTYRSVSGTLLVVEKSSLGKPLQGGVIVWYTSA